MAPQWVAMPPPVLFPGDNLAAAMTRLIADQQADLARLAAATEALAVAPDQALNAALQEMPRLGPGAASGVVMTALTTGQGSCSETVTYSYPGNGAAPQVAVRRSGNACPAGSPLVTGTEPSMIPRAQPQAPHLLDAATPPSWAPARQSRVALADRMAPAAPLASPAAPRLEPISYSPMR
jgi:hypothetical protein